MDLIQGIELMFRFVEFRTRRFKWKSKW